MKIKKIGTWTEQGLPTGWHFEFGKGDNPAMAEIMEVTKDGRVLVGGVEIVEWTNERLRLTTKPIPDCSFSMGNL